MVSVKTVNHLPNCSAHTCMSPAVIRRQTTASVITHYWSKNHQQHKVKYQQHKRLI